MWDQFWNWWEAFHPAVQAFSNVDRLHIRFDRTVWQARFSTRVLIENEKSA